MEPRHYAWLLPGRLAVAERPGGGGARHRKSRRAQEQRWWREQGVGLIVSCMNTRHGLLDYALDGFAIRWHPLTDVEGAAAVIRRVADEVAGILVDDSAVVLVVGDAAGEWLTGLNAGLRLCLGVAGSSHEAVACAAADGLPVGSLVIRLVAECADTIQPSTAAA